MIGAGLYYGAGAVLCGSVYFGAAAVTAGLSREASARGGWAALRFAQRLKEKLMTQWYPEFLESLLERDANSDLSAGTVKVQLVDSGYTYSAAHDFFDDVTAGTRVGTAVTLGSKTFTNGLFDAVCPDFTALSGDAVAGFVVLIDTGNEATSRLVLHYDDAAVFPLTPLGLDQSLVWAPATLCDSVSSDNIWYPKFAEALFTRPSNSDLVAGTVKVVGVNLTGGGTTYTYSAAHEFLSSVSAGAMIGTAQTLGGKTFANGLFGASGITFPSLAGDSIEALLAYIDTGVAATSRLVGLIRNAQGLPLDPLGSNQPVSFPAGLLTLGATA